MLDGKEYKNVKDTAPKEEKLSLDIIEKYKKRSPFGCS